MKQRRDGQPPQYVIDHYYMAIEKEHMKPKAKKEEERKLTKAEFLARFLKETDPHKAEERKETHT